jgi:hypothetical protein
MVQARTRVMNQLQAVALNDGLHCKKKLWRKHGQLPQISVLPVRHPDLRKVILPHQLQNMLRVLAIRLLLPPPLRADLPRGMPLKAGQPQTNDFPWSSAK